MKIIGITGSIGCGKTYLANIIKSLGFSVYNPDVWVRNLYTKDYILKIIAKEFPQVFEKGIFYKRKLRNLVFNDNNMLQKLESIIHPFLRKELKRIIHKKAQKSDLLFLDVALLFEMKWEKFCDFIIIADVDKKIQIQRVIERDNISIDDFYKIISVQIPQEQKKELADYVIDTQLAKGINKVQLIKFIQEVL